VGGLITTFTSRFEAMIRERRETDRFAPLSTDTLKDMWDRWDAMNDVDGFSGEDIHAELNRRGEGQYCAV
jgi:hypothetical protein